VPLVRWVTWKERELRKDWLADLQNCMHPPYKIKDNVVLVKVSEEIIGHT